MIKFISSVFFLLSIMFVFAQENKPNIIWLVCEDQSAQFFPMYGDKTVSLPHLEKLAEDSVCLLYTSPSPRDRTRSRMPSSA